MPTAPVPVDLTPTVRAAVDSVERLTYTVEEALASLGIGRTTFYAELIHTGRLRTVMIGGRRLVPRSALVELVEGGVNDAA